ncbi:DNA-directed RNA polymerase subunit beta [Candidatus Gottesmanbacteria bacterium RIFCSPHIGHO2_02_FULL_40_13]|uniref:DNA-directed RNA polymerase subunit beta n=1 Tax=Candidatus Gottesmanbacteria bacterium RIFCSPHIGHO2_02_FULL_40_13 TaxID=1798384 RepID=A0A1F6A7B5_9BACT|nr:MAG: DNA-directed RNA polymerase subunit beta [Candidatus Gottesmanbacteria bacterium RIFCSPHIGHO2_02_FULL_40_13]
MAKQNSSKSDEAGGIKRVNWGSETANLPILDLIAVQKESYDWFINTGLQELLNEISPVEDFTGKNWILEFDKYYFDEARYTPAECLIKGLTFDAPLKAETKLTNKQTGRSVRQDVFLGDIPRMTDNGTFIINGVERCIVNQLVRSPGAYFTGTTDPSTGKILYSAEVRPLFGSWLDFSISRHGVLTVRIDRRRKYAATTLLRAVGISKDEELLHIFADTEKTHPYISATIEKDTTKSYEEAVVEIYRKMRPGEPAVLDNAEDLLKNLFFNPRRYSLGSVGRYKLNKKLDLNIPNNPENWILTKEDIIGIIKYLIRLSIGQGNIDDIDHLANRRIRRVGELVANSAFKVGLMRLERSIKERMSLAGTQMDLTPSQIVNARPIIASINDFFRTSQLSTILDQTNPLSELDNLRRLTVMGVGGISRERASFSIRDINSSQYSRICPVRSPEGPNIGLVTYLALYARVNEYGFLEAPYRKVYQDKNSGKSRVSEEIVYLSAEDEQNYYVTHAGVTTDKKGFFTEDRIPARYKGEFLETEAKNISFIDVVPRQVVGIAASLVPFIAHDEANRALMGTHMQCQAVPLVIPASPVVGTGMEYVIPQALKRAVYSPEDGKVIYIDASKVTIKGKSGKEYVYIIEKFKRTSQNTCFSQNPVVSLGSKVKKGQLIIDGPASEAGELALGQNLVIAYSSFDGMGYEDAIVISDRLVKEDILTSISIEEYETEVVDTKLGPEETTRDIPNVGEEALANLDEKGIVVIGADVVPNDILVGKIAPKGETELTAEERLLRAIFGEKAREVRDTSLRMPHGEKGTVIEVKILDREKGDELHPGTIKKIIVKVAQIRKVVVGDKLAGRHGNKGVISKIVPVSDMPYLGNGEPVDIIISPLSVLSRMNLGQLLEAHLGWAASHGNYKVAVPVFEPILEENIVNELKKYNLPIDGKTVLYDGRTGKPFQERIVVGIGYIMKLIHMVEDKTHARSTGPYSLVTQQPLGGKAQMGGQRLGEMEVWALEAHRAAYTLQEMLTIKSDDVVGRARAFEAIVKGNDIPASTIPESFKVLVKELQALGLKVNPIGVVTALPKKLTDKVADDAVVPDAGQEDKDKKSESVVQTAELQAVVEEPNTKEDKAEKKAQ